MTSKRNPDNGLFDNVNYVYKDGDTNRIDWLRMIKPEYLVFNTQQKDKIEAQYGKPLSELKVTEVEDKYLLILLAGLKEVAALRGYMSVNVRTEESTIDNCVVTTHITWIPNVETNGDIVSYGDVAGANKNNTMPIGKNKLGEYVWYLETIAANRSFCRAVRSFLGIHIVARDEIGSSFTVEPAAESSGLPDSSPQAMLEKKCKAQKCDLAKLKIAAAKNKEIKLFGDPAKWESWADISSRDCFSLLGAIEENAIKKV